MPDLRPPAHRVSRRAVRFWAVRAGLGWLVVLGLLVAMFWGTRDPAVRVIVLAIVLLLALTHVIVMPIWRYRVHRWETTSDAVYTQSGWLNQERRIAPMSRIQTVDTERGPLEQLFRLANVTVTTASAAGPLKIRGLDLATAETLAQELTERTQSLVGDAT